MRDRMHRKSPGGRSSRRRRSKPPNGLPWHLSETVPNQLSQPALRGEPNGAVFAELGHSGADIRDCAACDILVERPPR
jgi:hypothetical protein